MQSSLFEPAPPRPAPTPEPHTVSRFRLALVREEAAVYDASGDPENLSNPDRIAAVLWERIFEAEPRECMVAVYLDIRNRLIGWTVAYSGGLGRCVVEPRGILVPALLANAAGIVLAHNHPSGDPSPSPDDLAFTRRVADAAETIGIRLHDSLVVADAARWVSLQQRGGWR